MRFKLAALVLALSVVVCVALWTNDTAAVADTKTDAAAGAVAAVTLSAGDEKQYSYVGSKTCKKCHLAVYKSWAKTKMGQAFETLKPGNAKENKEKFKIDLAKDFSKDEKCVKCHTVGYGKPGGYTIPDPSDKKAVRRAKKREGVGCENCHGPGSEYVKLHKKIMKSKRKYKREEMYAAGMWKIEKAVCVKCHNEESPTINPGDPFDFEEKKDKGTHEHKPLKQREG